jgi:hypothetical protein
LNEVQLKSSSSTYRYRTATAGFPSVAAYPNTLSDDAKNDDEEE